jgi:polyferredoxin
MENLMLFLKIIAWPIAVLSTISFFLTFWSASNYSNSLEKIIDEIKGKEKIFRPITPAAIALICWAFLISF